MEHSLLIISDTVPLLLDGELTRRGISPTVVGRFTEAQQWLADNDASAAIALAEAGGESLLSFWHLFLGIPYFALGSEQNSALLELPIAPVGLYGLPLEQAKAGEILSQMPNGTEMPSQKAIDEIAGDDLDLLHELMAILERQFDESIQKMPYLYENDDMEGIIQVVHKLLGKFSLLSMPRAFSVFNQVESHLRNGHRLHPHTYRRVLSDLDKGLIFIRNYNQNNEVHHS